MSKRTFAAAIVLAWLPWGVPAAAQCQKRILLYVDMSGSMGQPRGPGSPFRQTVDAVQELLRIPGLIAATDELLLLPFSDAVGSAEPVLGSQQGVNALARLGEPSARYTDLVAVFDDITRRLEQPSGADRELVIVASDFVHDPGPTSRHANWSQEQQARGAAWSAAVTPSGGTGRARVALALLRAPATERAGDAEAFVGGLQALRPKPLQVGVRGQSAAGLARDLSQLFYVPPEVSTLLVGPHKFEVTARNVGCMPLTLRDAVVGCEGDVDRDAVRESFTDSSRTLEGVSSASSVRVVTVDAARLSCPGAYEVKVSTEQGVVGTGQATHKSRIEFELLRAILGEQFGEDEIELRVKVWGAVTDPSEFAATLSLGRDGRPRLVDGRLLPLRELETSYERARIYRIVAPLDNAYRARLVQDGINLAIEGSPSRPQHASVQVDPATWWSHVAGGPPAALLAVAMFGAYSRFKRRMTAWRDFSDIASLLLNVGPPLVLCGWVIVGGRIYGWTPGAWLIEYRDALSLIIVSGLLIFGGWRVWRMWFADRVIKELARGVPVARTVQVYKRRVSFAWPTLLAGVLMLAAFGCIAWLHMHSPRRGDAAVATMPFTVR